MISRRRAALRAQRRPPWFTLLSAWKERPMVTSSRLAYFFLALALVPPVLAQQPADPVEASLRRLSQGGVQGGLEALATLADSGPKAEKSLPALLKLLEVNDEDQRLHAALAL